MNDIPETVDESQDCERCVREAVYDGRRESDWDSFLAWRRKREGKYKQ
jgi:hypothetical protein